MKPLLALLTAVSLGLGAGACGGAGKGTGSAFTGAGVGETSASIAPGAASNPRSFMGDADNDDKGTQGSGYYDSDDSSTRYYGHAASAADARAITMLVKRYYAAAVAEDGAGACALTYFIVVESIPEEYGQPPGPLYLRGAKTCAAVLSIVFKHFHRQLTAAVTVTGVRVNGPHADVLLGFRALPAGFIVARRERGAWKIDGLLTLALP